MRMILEFDMKVTDDFETADAIKHMKEKVLPAFISDLGDGSNLDEKQQRTIQSTVTVLSKDLSYFDWYVVEKEKEN